MKKASLSVILFFGIWVSGRSGGKLSTVTNGIDGLAHVERAIPVQDTSIILNNEDDIKAKLIFLVLNNGEAVAADANVRIAKIARKKANSSILGSVNLGGNVNEFVINNSPAANFFPKYNFGLTIPLDMFAKNRAEKRTADEMIIINTSQKALVNEALKAKVLSQYETYKEKKELLELQLILTEDDNAAYEKAQKDYKAELVTIEDVNRVYRQLIISRSTLASKQKELNVAIIEIEEMIGVPLKTVLEKRQN